METTTNTISNQPMTLKRSAAQVHAAAIASGWEVQSAVVEMQVQKLSYTRNDAEAQAEAYAVPGSRTKPITAFTASFDPEQGSYYGVRFSDDSSQYVNGWNGDTLSDVIRNVERPAAAIATMHARRESEAAADIKQAKREAFVENYRQSVTDDNQGYGWSVKRMQETASMDVAAATLEDGYNDPSRYLRAASNVATQMVKKALAAEALKRFGQPQEYTNGEFYSGTSLQDALTKTIAEAFRNYSNKDILPQLADAASELDRGY